MSRRHLLTIIGCTLFLLVSSSCGQKGARSVEEIEESLVIAKPDTSLYGTLKSVRPDSLVFISEFDEQPITCIYDEARGRKQFFGSLTEGNRYALLIDPEEKAAIRMVNLTELSGQWFYDLEEQRGMTFTAAGALSSINPKDVSFKKWKFHNGKIVLYYTDIEAVVSDSREYESDTIEIESLTSENLDFQFRGEKLHCTRQHGPIKLKIQI